jgi:hypothetical protein
MDKVLSSQFFNYLLGGSKDEMLSARVYREKRMFLVFVIDSYFYIARRQRQHCKRSYFWQKYHEQMKRKQK